MQYESWAFLPPFRYIRPSSDPYLAGSYAAMLRASKSAEDLAIKTNTGIIVSIDGKPVRLTATDLIKMRGEEAQKHIP